MNEDATRVADMLAEVVQAMNEGRPVPPSGQDATHPAGDGIEYEGTDAEQFLQEWPLEIEVHGKRDISSDDWSVTSVDVTLGLGGPTEWVEFGEVDSADVHHAWGSDHQIHRLSPALAEQLAVVWGIDEVLS